MARPPVGSMAYKRMQARKFINRLKGIRPKVSKMKVVRFSGPRPELKFFDNAVAYTADTTNEIPATGQLCTISQGDGQSQRDGRKIFVKSILMRGTVTLTPGALTSAYSSVFIWVVQDTQCNGAAATVANDDTGIFTAAGANPALAVRCLANTDRFKILKKIVVSLGAQAGVSAAYNESQRVIDQYIPCNIPIEYDASAATGALTTMRSNNIFLVSGSTLLDDVPAVAMTVRLRFQG